MRGWKLSAGGLLLGLHILGCGEDGPSGAPPAASRPAIADRPVIAFVAAAPNDPLWPVLKTSAELHLQQWDAFEVRFLVPEKDEPQSQADLLAALSEPRLRGLCIHIRDADAVQKQLEQLQQSGVSIVSMIQPAPTNCRVAHVGLDESAIGRALADATADLLGEQGTIMLIQAGPDHPAFGLRLMGMRERLRIHRQLEVLASIDCQADPQAALAAIQDRSPRYPRLSAWVALDDWPLRALTSDNPLPPNTRLITFGGLPHQWPLLRSGVLPVLVAADYGELGGKALQFCENAIRNTNPQRLPDHYIAPLRTLRSEDLDAYERDWRTWTGQDQ